MPIFSSTLKRGMDLLGEVFNDNTSLFWCCALCTPDKSHKRFVGHTLIEGRVSEWKKIQLQAIFI